MNIMHFYFETLILFFRVKMVGFWLLIQVVIVSNEEEKNQFIREVGEEVLPEEFGGKAKLIAIQDVVLPSLED